MFKSRIFLISFALVGVAAQSQAQLVNTAGLITSPDGVGTDLQTLVRNTGSLSSVGSASNFGDQESGRLFEFVDPTKSADWSVLFQKAGFANKHKIGYYTDLTALNPQITWVLGGASSGFPTSTSVKINGTFGLAFSSGDNATPSTVYYSETWRNPNNQNRAVVLKDRDAAGVKPAGLLVAWEDLPNLGDKDYNDIGLNLGGIRAKTNNPVPEPASMLALGVGVLAMFRRRKQSA